MIIGHTGIRATLKMHHVTLHTDEINALTNSHMGVNGHLHRPNSHHLKQDEYDVFIVNIALVYVPAIPS